MTEKIKSVAVLGAGTMGSGIAGLCAERDCQVLLLDVSMEAAEKGANYVAFGAFYQHQQSKPNSTLIQRYWNGGIKLCFHHVSLLAE